MKEQELKSDQTTQPIRIVEYTPELADAVADMWNHSREGWGGGTSIMTGEQVRQREAQSGNKNLFLAMDGDKVVGYCGLSEYKEDVGALYIPLLNARTDYHGKKIGKMLVLEALKKTIELGWPRLDLYTWAGNTKAVPLYKKCGFFWEDRDDSTHLMNFMPTVLHTEWVEDFFREVDWYNQSTREIEVAPDGRKENGFDFYTYTWEQGGQTLTMEFERKGRGLRLVDHQDFYIAASLKQAECITGCAYQVEYHIINKTSQPLEVKIEGEDDGNISFHYSAYEQVETEKKLVGDFFVGAIAEEQSVWRTHPTVKANIWVNGKKATFALGVLPKLPAKMTVKLPKEQSFLGQASTMYLDVENNVDEELEYSFAWPEVSWLRFHDLNCQFKLKPKAKLSIPVAYTLQSFGFYEQELAVQAISNAGEVLNFTRSVGLSFQGMGAAHFGESEEYWHICHGLYEVKLSKFNNDVLPHKLGSSGNQVFWRAPQLGKPYSLEFAKKRPTQVHFTQEGGAVCLKAIYHSNEIAAVELVRTVKLYADGFIEHRYSFKNLSGVEIGTELAISEPVFYVLSHTTLPYQGRLLVLDQGDGEEYSNWDAKKISENWLFAVDQEQARGFCWSPKHQLSFNSWFLALEYELGTLKPHEEVHLEATYVCLDVFRQVQDFQQFARQRYGLPITVLEQMDSKDNRRGQSPTAKVAHEFASMELVVQEHNPILTKAANVELKLHMLAEFAGQLSIQSKAAQHRKTIDTAMLKDKSEGVFEWSPSAGYRVDVLQAEAETSTQVRKLEAAVFYPSDQAVKLSTHQEEGENVFVVENGSLRFKAAPHFYPSVFSLQDIEQGDKGECLNSSYPEARPKAWWNPWGGGVFSKPRSLNLISLLREERTASFCALQDQFGNVWQGIQMRVELKQHDKLKGLAWNQYYVTMPGLPLMAYVVEIEQETHTSWQQEEWTLFTSILKEGSGAFDSYTVQDDPLANCYKLGESELELELTGNPSFYRKGRSDQLQMIRAEVGKQEYLYNSKDVTELIMAREVTAAHGQSVFLAPIFFLLHQERISEAALRDLRGIRFSKKL